MFDRTRLRPSRTQRARLLPGPRIASSALVGWILLLFLQASPLFGQRRPGGTGVTAVWMGQKQQDRVGPSSKPGASGVQDLIFELRGLPGGVPLKTIEVRGQGGDEWLYQGRYGPWAAALERPEEGERAWIFLEPTRDEKGRTFDFKLTFESGQVVSFTARGGPADSNLRMPEAALTATWRGLVDQDRTGPSPAVGPDGFQDVHIQLSRLAPKIEVKEVRIAGPKEDRWCAGLNSKGFANAEFLPVASDPGTGDLYFSPIGAIKSGSVFVIELDYANGKSDRCEISATSDVEPRAIPAVPLPRLLEHDAKAVWQASKPLSLRLEGLPRASGYVAVVVSDDHGRCWVDKKPGIPDPDGVGRARPVRWSQPDRSGSATLEFESGKAPGPGPIWLRLLLSDGAQILLKAAGPDSRNAARTEDRNPSERVARTPAELLRLIEQPGRLRLAKGTFRLDRPLILSQPVELLGESGTVLEFEQQKSRESWKEAVSIQARSARISDLKIQFRGPVRWDDKVPFGPALIGTVRPEGVGDEWAVSEIELSRVEIEAPEATSDWEKTPSSLRLMHASGGWIRECTFTGGTIEIAGGPWEIARNHFLGPPKNSFAYSVITAHQSRDLWIQDNQVRPKYSNAKLWRFVVLARTGHGARIERNEVVRVGPRDDDVHPHPNAPEVILTESYRTRYEGRVASVERDGTVLRIHAPQGEPIRVGDFAAIVSGPQAGAWAQVVQVLSPEIVELDRPLPASSADVVIGPGFVDQLYQNNTIDCTGSTVAMPFVLAGSHYGTKVLENRIAGGGFSMRVTAFPTEEPVHWGWSYTPSFDVSIEKNLVVDSARGGYLGVERTASSKRTSGRLYFTATVLGNHVSWTQTVAWEKSSHGPIAWTLGRSDLGEPGEAILKMRESSVSAPSSWKLGPTLRIECATVNGQPYRNAFFDLERRDQTASAAGAPSR